MKYITLSFAVVATLFGLAALYAAIFCNATHQYFMIIPTGLLSWVLFNDYKKEVRNGN